MANELRNKSVAVLVEQGFEQSELTEPKKALEEAGATADIVSPQSGKVKGWKHANWGDEFHVDRRLEDANPNEYRCTAAAGWRNESGQAPDQPCRGELREALRRQRQADRGDLPCAVDSHRRGGRARTPDDLVALPSVPTSATPAPTGSIRRSSWIRGW